MWIDANTTPGPELCRNLCRGVIILPNYFPDDSEAEQGAFWCYLNVSPISSNKKQVVKSLRIKRTADFNKLDPAFGGCKSCEANPEVAQLLWQSLS